MVRVYGSSSSRSCNSRRSNSHSHRWVLWVGLLLGNAAWIPSVSALLCVDDEARLTQLLVDRGMSATANGCGDALPFCNRQGDLGRMARSICCATCGANDVVDNSNNSENPPPSLLTDPVDNNRSSGGQPQQLPPNDKPLELFLLGGQSECKGSAMSSNLFGASNKYPELQGTIDGVWFATYQGEPSPNSFFIAPMSADVDRPEFGPELSFAERMVAATSSKSNILMVKYCEGGTNVREHWNPTAAANSWNHQADDGTAAWLQANVGLTWTKTNIKQQQFVTLIYTIRRTQEALEAAGVPYSWSGIVWLQGAGDNGSSDPMLWKIFGDHTANVWNGFRKELSRKSNGQTIPIIDTGAMSYNQLKSGKEYATQVVKGGLAKNIEYGIIAQDDTGTCRIKGSISCFGEDGFYVNYGVSDYFGYDPNVLATENLPAAAAGTSKTFHWYVKYPSNLHSAYEGMIVNGRMLANAYLREFSEAADYDLAPFASDDIATLFPYDRCPDETLPSATNICWIDYRQSPFLPQPTEALIGPSPTEAPVLQATAPVGPTDIPQDVQQEASIIPATDAPEAVSTTGTNPPLRASSDSSSSPPPCRVDVWGIAGIGATTILVLLL